MGHIQQLAFALGPAETRPAAPVRPRPGARAARRPGDAVQPLLLPDGPAAPPAAPPTADEPMTVTGEPVMMAPAPAPPSPLPAPLPLPTVPPQPSAAPAAAPPALPPVPPRAAAGPPLSDGGAALPAKATLYVVIGFARGRERRRSGWRRLAEQGFPSRRPAEEHAARLLARGRADGVILARQELGPDMDAADEPVILARHGELPAELAEG
jgi:hypothetical protein